MTFELAEKLYTAGFSNPRWQSLDLEHCQLEKDILVEDAPTLAELIKACDNTFIGVNRDSMYPSKDGEWYALGRNYEKTGLLYNSFYGHSLEETVAKLWLALQANKWS